jgi:hypothetical protein
MGIRLEISIKRECVKLVSLVRQAFKREDHAALFGLTFKRSNSVVQMVSKLN